MANFIAAVSASRHHVVKEVRLDDVEVLKEFSKVRKSGLLVFGYDDAAVLDRDDWREAGIIPPKSVEFEGGADLAEKLEDAALSGVAWCAWVVVGPKTTGLQLAVHRMNKAWDMLMARPVTDTERTSVLKRRGERLAKGRAAAAERRAASEA